MNKNNKKTILNEQESQRNAIKSKQNVNHISSEALQFLIILTKWTLYNECSYSYTQA